MKHIKAFTTQTEVATYEQSSNYVEPYIGASYDSVAAHYNHNTPVYKQFYDYDDETHQYNLYEQVEYIENPSNAYIDTGVNPDNRMIITAEVQVMQKVAQIRIFGGRGSLIGLEIYTNGQSNASTLFAYSMRDIKDGSDWVSMTVYSTNKVKFLLNTTPTQNTTGKTGLTIYNADGSVLKYVAPKYWINASPNATYSYDTSVTIAICGFNYVSGSEQYFGNSSKLRIYSFSILNTRTNTYTRDFIPVKRINDNVYGLWDRANSKFYVSPNGTHFTGGAKMIYDANDVQYQQVEYISNPNKGYINTGLYASSNTKVECSVKFAEISRSQAIFGCRTADGSTKNSFVTWGLESNTFRNDFIDTNNTVSGITVNTSTTYNITKQAGTLTVNNKSSATITGTLTNNSTTLYIFNVHQPNPSASQYFTGQLYYFKVYNSNTLMRDFIPVKRVSDSKYGLFDRVNRVFYTAGNNIEFTGA